MERVGARETFMMTGETEVSNLEYLRKKKAELEEQQAEIGRQIEVLKAQEEQERQISTNGLYNRMDSLIKTSLSSFSDVSIGDVIEYAGELSAAGEYSRTIDIEISARYREGDIDDDRVYSSGVSALGKRYVEDPTLVVSYLIPYDLIRDDLYFKQKEK